MLATPQISNNQVQTQPQQHHPAAMEAPDPVAMGLEFMQAVLSAHSLEEVQLLLTNDIRCMIAFDRSFLITHLGGKSKFVAASALLSPEKKSRFYRQLTNLGPRLAELDRPILTSREYVDRLAEHGVSDTLQRSLKTFINFTDSVYLFCLPLTYDGAPIAHLIFEFLDDSVPDRDGVFLLGKLAAPLGAGLAQAWLAKTKPAVAALMRPGIHVEQPPLQTWIRRLRFIIPIFLLLVVVLFLIPFDRTVGGEAEVVSGERHLAFCKMDGLIDKVYVEEGSEVAKGAVLATIDPKELEFSINIAQRELDIQSKEMSILADSAGNNPAKLAQAQLVELNRQKKLKDLEYLKARREFLEIRAPVAGIVTTKNVQSLSGKRLPAGEPLCEIVVRSELCVDVHVPEARVSVVTPGQEGTMYFNSDPGNGHQVKVKEIAPRAEALPRFGNIFRVRAEFVNPPGPAMVGMKGVGKIHAGTASLWTLITQRILTSWNKVYASFS